GPILRLTNQRSPRRTSSARRLIAALLHSVGYPARSSPPRLLPQIELPRFPDQCLSELIVLFRGDELESGAHRRCGKRRGNTLRCESIIQSPCLVPKSLRNCPPRSVRFLIGSTVSFRLRPRKCGSTSGQLTFPRYRSCGSFTLLMRYSNSAVVRKLLRTYLKIA